MAKISGEHIAGHLMALFTVFVWGVTFIASKILLEHFSPLEIMTLRFSLAYVGLWLVYPKFVKPKSFKDEFLYFAAGATGVFGYFLMENTAIVYTTVSNTGLILAGVPIFVAIVFHFFTEEERFQMNFLYGFIIAMIGVALIIYNGQINLEVNPFGDFLAIMAGVVWSLYSLTLYKIDKDMSPFFVTRRSFFYGILLGYIMIFTYSDGIDLSPMYKTNAWIYLGFLGLVGSATCYVMWNKSMKLIGVNKTSSYVYLMPLFTMIASSIVLDERITQLMVIGCALILMGVYISENGFKLLKKKEVINED